MYLNNGRNRKKETNATGMVAILEDTRKLTHKTHGPSGVLSRLWRQILLDSGITLARYNSIMEAHILDVKNGVPNNKRDQISYRGNMTKELAKPQMSWKVFMKALKFLNITNIELTIACTHSNKRTTVHSTKVNLGNIHSDPKDFNNALDLPEDQEEIQTITYLDTEE